MRRYTTLALVILTCSSCHKIKEKAEETQQKVITHSKALVKRNARKVKDLVIDFLRKPVVTDFSILDRYPEFKKEEYGISYSAGIKCDVLPIFYCYYFVYKGDKQRVFDYILSRDCRYTEKEPDSLFVPINREEFEQQFNSRTELEIEKTRFFFRYTKANSTDLMFYQCYRTPEVHYVVYDKRVKLIYHFIENFRE